MLNQIFKHMVPNEILFSLLDKICVKMDKYYLIDMNSYRKMLFHEYNIVFCNKLREYYHNGKMFYINRKISYKSFTNIVRQICKANNIKYCSGIKYNESNYNINYMIYYEEIDKPDK
jgi:hypothetical protein